jgi:SAM-dependent methyltransferase
MSEREQTLVSFRDKWTNNTQLAFDETLRAGSDIFNWILTRNGFATGDELSRYLATKRRILDAGCGNGRVTALLHAHAPPSAEVVAIDLTAAEVARENLKNHERVTVDTRDLLGDLQDLGEFDFVYCQEVLHHTGDPKAAFLNLCGRLTEGGEIAIYVYKLKAPIREHADDLIRDRISGLPYDQAMALMREVTELGRVLSETGVKLTVPDVKVLDIPAGEYDLQRFLYHFFLKCFWSPELSHEENVAINYDWYHPQLCTRHSLDEVLGWFEVAGLDVVHQCVDFYGITVRGRRVKRESR